MKRNNARNETNPKNGKGKAPTKMANATTSNRKMVTSISKVLAKPEITPANILSLGFL